MTAQNNRKLGEEVTNQDAFGTPAAARGSMMNVAGKTDDELEPGEELLTDEGDDTTMKGPIYPEVKMIRLGELRKLIKNQLSR